MDNKNRILLQRYTENPRISATALSSELKITKNAVIERIKSLKKKKIILGSSCMINYFKLGFSQYLLFIRSKNVFAGKEFINKIDLNPVVEILSLFGQFNLYIKFIAKDDEQKQEFIEKITEDLEVEDYELIELTHYDLIPAKKYHKEEKTIPSSYFPSNHKQPLFQCDKTDLSIIKELCRNAEQSLAIIADKLKQSPQVIAYRFKRLLKEKVILRCYGFTDIFNSALQLYFLRFELTKPTESLDLFKRLIRDQHIQDISILNHKKNFFCILESETRKEMLTTIENLIKINSNVKSIQVDIFLDQIYYNLFPNVINN
jgi:DNA-binding Lrp family transcriptional regulator